MQQLSTPVTDEQLAAALAGGTYEEVATRFEVSRGRVYAAALRLGARKHELRIQQRKAERVAQQKEFLASVVGATAKADVLDFLDGLPDGSAAMVLTSPPYNVAKTYGGGLSDNFSLAYYTGWMMQVCSEACRILKDGGVLFLQVGATRGQDGQMLPIDCLLFQHIAQMGMTFQSRVVWTVPHGLTPRRRLAERHETALVFSKGQIATFNPTPARVPQKQPGKRAFKGPNRGQLSGNPFGAFPSNVWSDIGNACHNHKDGVSGHPAQMPAELARRAIQLYTVAGDLVVDPFSGSGTTHAECIRTGRAFAGADLHYEDVRRERLARIAPDLVSVLPGITDESMALWQAEATPVFVPAREPEQLRLTA